MERGGAPLFGRYPWQKTWYLQVILSFPNRNTCNPGPGGVSSFPMAGAWEMDHFATFGVRLFFGESARTHSANHVGLALSTLCPRESLGRFRYISLMMLGPPIARKTPTLLPHPNPPLLRVMYMMMLMKCARPYVRFSPRLHKRGTW